MQGPLLRLWAIDTCPAWLAVYNAVAIQASGHVLVSPSINNQGELGYFILDTGVCTACCLCALHAACKSGKLIFYGTQL